MSGKLATKSYYYFVKSVKRDIDVDFTGCGTFFGGGRCFEDSGCMEGFFSFGG